MLQKYVILGLYNTISVQTRNCNNRLTSPTNVH